MGYGITTGYVEVYLLINLGGNWTQLGQTIYGDVTDDNFGLSVDITADGTTIICGSSGAITAKERPGYVRVFKLVSDSDIGTNTWVKIGQDITGETNSDMFGNSVSISEDGKKIVIGAPNYDGVNGDRVLPGYTNWMTVV